MARPDRGDHLRRQHPRRPHQDRRGGGAGVRRKCGRISAAAKGSRRVDQGAGRDHPGRAPASSDQSREFRSFCRPLRLHRRGDHPAQPRQRGCAVRPGVGGTGEGHQGDRRAGYLRRDGEQPRPCQAVGPGDGHPGDNRPLHPLGGAGCDDVHRYDAMERGSYRRGPDVSQMRNE